METRKLKLSELLPNKGQIDGLPKNPRKWGADELLLLERSLEETPELAEIRGVIVKRCGDKYVVLCGNMRHAAAKALGWKEMTAHILPDDTPLQTMREIVIKDNQSFGDWDFDELANQWDNLPLNKWGLKTWEISDGFDQEQDGEAEDDEAPDTPMVERIIIVYDKEDEGKMAALLGLEQITRILYTIKELTEQ